MSYKLTDTITTLKEGNYYVLGSFTGNIIDKLNTERWLSSILADSKSHAVDLLISVIESSKIKYEALLKLYHDELDNLLLGDETTSREIITSKDGSMTDDAYTDSQLRKFNETPQAGNNPNLLSDTYLSESERNTVDGGERVRTITDEGTSSDITNRSNNLERALSLRAIEDNISDLYRNWMRDIDREILVYEIEDC